MRSSHARAVNESFSPNVWPQADSRGSQVTRAVVDSLEPRLLMASISGTVYNDLNGNGRREVGEPGLAGWVITIGNKGVFPGGGGGQTTVVSDAAGNYSWGNRNMFSPPILVREVVPPGWRLTQPASGYYVIQGPTTYSGRNFGNRYVGAPVAVAAAPTGPAAISLTSGAGATHYDKHFFADQPIIL